MFTCMVNLRENEKRVYSVRKSQFSLAGFFVYFYSILFYLSLSQRKFGYIQIL